MTAAPSPRLVASLPSIIEARALDHAIEHARRVHEALVLAKHAETSTLRDRLIVDASVPLSGLICGFHKCAGGAVMRHESRLAVALGHWSAQNPDVNLGFEVSAAFEEAKGRGR